MSPSDRSIKRGALDHTVEHRVGDSGTLPHATGDFAAAYDFSRRLETLEGPTPCKIICETRPKEPNSVTSDPIRQISTPNTQAARYLTLTWS